MNAWVCVPTRGEIDYIITGAHAQFAHSLGTGLNYQRGHLSVAVNRNKIVQRFLETDADCLVMVDDDVAPSPNANAIVDALDKYDVVAAAMPMFDPALWPIPVYTGLVETADGTYRPAYAGEPKLVECDAVGTGCVAIKREVLEAVAEPFGDYYNGENYSDDIVFCKKLKAEGFRIACDYRTLCDHFVTVSLGHILNGIAEHQRRVVKDTLAKQARTTRPADQFGMVVAP